MSKPIRVLMIEDSEDDASLLLHSLKKADFDVVEHERVETLDGLSAALAKHEWDLLISDHSLPQFSPLLALTELRGREIDTPLIIVSGTIEADVAVSAMRAGARDFIMKSDLTRLIPAIERELQEAENRRARRAAEHEKSLLQAQLIQSQKMEAIGRLAGGVAHDFNNLLTAISGYSHFLLSTMKSDDPQRADVEEIKKAGERAASLTRQLLAFSRQQVIQMRLIDLNVIAQDMEKMLRRLIGEDINLDTRLARDLGKIKADTGQIEQIILNLVVNARDAMPNGGRLTIETSNVKINGDYAKTHLDLKPGAYVMLAVTDSGAGMDQKTLSHLFEPFFTTKEQGKGTGLGLATVHGIVKQSNGSIFVYSELGQGTSFKIYFPRADDQAEAPGSAPQFKASRGTETLLLAEDDEQVRKFIVRALTQSGYNVLVARHPEEAELLAVKNKDAIRLLITDIVMPGMRGEELAKRISELCPKAKVIYTSGYTEAGMAHRGSLSPNINFIQKPINPDELLGIVRNLLDQNS